MNGADRFEKAPAAWETWEEPGLLIVSIFRGKKVVPLIVSALSGVPGSPHPSLFLSLTWLTPASLQGCRAMKADKHQPEAG